MVASVQPLPEIGVGSAYGNAWRQLWPNFLALFLIGVIAGVIYIGVSGLDAVCQYGVQVWESGNGAGAAIAIVAGLLAIAYGLLINGPIKIGVAFAYLKAARNDPPAIKDMFEAFQNYWNAVLAGFLVAVIVLFGLLLLIVPGIIFGCKLWFTPYLVVDRKMSAIEAMKESWRMTTGHAWKVFFVGVLGIPITFAGILCLIVGVIISVMWITLAFASLYHAVSSSDDMGFGVEDLGVPIPDLPPLP